MRFPVIAKQNSCFAGIVLIASSLGVSAEAPKTLETQLVTASSLPTTSATASQHVTVLRRAELEAMRGQSLVDILSQQAGLVIDQGPRSGAFGSLYLRGADPSHVVVLIDYVRQNDPLSSRGSAVDFSALSVDDIERIEIVRGNSSVANAEAMAGVIHIFTRRAARADTERADFNSDLGSDGLRGASARWVGKNAQLGVSSREDGNDAGGFSRTRAANASWDGAFGEALSLGVRCRISDNENQGFPDDSGGFRFARLRALDARQSDNQQLTARGVYGAQAGTLEAQLSTFSRDGDAITPGVAPGLRDPFGLPRIVERSDYTRDEAQLTWLMPLGDAVLMTVGAQHQREQGRLDSLIDFGSFQLPAPFQLERNTSSTFAEARWQMGEWIWQGGLRHESYGGEGTVANSDETHPALSVQQLSPRFGQWGASIARSSKAPSFYALGQPLVGNSALKPERAQQRELFYAFPAGYSWPTRITFFSAQYRDLIDFDPGPPPQLVNRARIKARGTEWHSSHRFENGWSLQLNGAWMHLRDPEGGSKLRHRPRLQAAAQLAVPMGKERLLSLSLRHLGRRFDSAIPTGELELKAITTIDLSLSQDFGSVQLLAAIDNLGNTRVDETLGNPLPARRLRLALSWRL